MSERSLNGSARTGRSADVSIDVGGVIRRSQGVRAQGLSRRCSRPGCEATAAATLTFSYISKEVWLSELAGEADPDAYDLCDRHADRTGAPSGWRLTDRRFAGNGDETGRPPGFRTVHTAGVEQVEDPPQPDDPDGPGPARAW